MLLALVGVVVIVVIIVSCHRWHLPLWLAGGENNKTYPDSKAAGKCHVCKL